MTCTSVTVKEKCSVRRLRYLLLLVMWVSCPSVAAAPSELNSLRQAVAEARQQGEMDSADQLAQQYLSAAIAQADQKELGNVYYQLGRNAMERNNYPQAREYLEQAVSQYKSAAATLSLANALRQLGQTFRYQSDYQKALEYLYQAMQLYQQLNDPSAIASGYNSIGTTLEKMGQYEQALQAHQQSLTLHYQTGNKSGIASAIFNLGDLHRVLGDTSQALTYFQQALELDKANGNLRDIAYSHNKLGYLYSESGDYQQAADHLQQALSLFEQISAPRDADWARTNQAKLAMHQGNFPQAVTLITGVISRATVHNYNSLLVDAYKLATELAITMSEYDTALTYIDAGVNLARQNLERADEAQLWQMRVNVLLQQDRPREALAALMQQNKLEDDIFNNKRVSAIASIQAQTEFIRQQQQIDRLQQQQILQQALLEQHRWSRNFWILGLAAAFILLLSLYRRLIQKRLNQRLSQQVAARTAELHQKNNELSLAYQQLETISLTDKLTGLHNRRFLEDHIESDLEHCRRMQQDWQAGKTARPKGADLVVFMIDLDNFKALNDTYGHSIGDLILKQLKHRMQQVFRQTDYLVRWGGEEFVAVARFIEREDASQLAGRFVESVHSAPFEVDKQHSLNVSCSVGYACYPFPEGATTRPWPALLRLADLCLYAAKYSGRNGWVGVQHYQSALPLDAADVDATQLQRAIADGDIEICHSFTDTLNWLPPV
ncbi:TPA: GGDEF domain-containing protein [Candidatus Azambacteria bacterium]|nr:GGDEF domain-containing protein [Candidatus Azambacteria bacterium]